MQFHLNGFRPGDPKVSDDTKGSLSRLSLVPSIADVLIIGCGPAGLTLANQLSKYPSIKTVLVDQKLGALKLGQADGVACRTMEMFEAFSFSEGILKEAYWVNETTFWKPSSKNGQEIERSSRIQDTEDGLSEFPHVILNQARVHDYLLEDMYNAPYPIKPNYGLRLINSKINDVSKKGFSEDHPVVSKFQKMEDPIKTKIYEIRSKFIVGCDGARSVVRDFLKINLRGESANQLWGVMDVLAVTDFPDIRFKSVVQSSQVGNLLIIPREGGYLVRLYIELDKLSKHERVSSKNIKIETLIASAKRILNPYNFEVKEVVWWSVYEIGQRIADQFDNSEGVTEMPRGFIVGDACHTHSPKAGQGMNVAMADSFNLGWKLGSVLTKQCASEILKTYSKERRSVASQLINFDKEFARMFSARPKTLYSNNNEEIDPKEFERYFTRYGRFTAGTITKYSKSVITRPSHNQHLAKGYLIGMRFHSSPILRFFDGKPMHFGHTLKADGRWRLLIFSDNKFLGQDNSTVHNLCQSLSKGKRSLIRKYTPDNQDIDSIFDVRAVFQISHQSLQQDWLPPLLTPTKGKYKLIDYEKVFCPDFKSKSDIFEERGVDRKKGCLIVVRPDQHVAGIFGLDSEEEILKFFDSFMEV